MLIRVEIIINSSINKFLNFMSKYFILILWWSIKIDNDREFGVEIKTIKVRTRDLIIKLAELDGYINTKSI